MAAAVPHSVPPRNASLEHLWPLAAAAAAAAAGANPAAADKITLIYGRRRLPAVDGDSDYPAQVVATKFAD